MGRLWYFLYLSTVVKLCGSLLLPLLAVVVDLTVLVGYVHEALGNRNHILVAVSDTQLLEPVRGLRCCLLVFEGVSFAEAVVNGPLVVARGVTASEVMRVVSIVAVDLQVLAAWICVELLQ